MIIPKKGTHISRRLVSFDQKSLLFYHPTHTRAIHNTRRNKNRRCCSSNTTTTTTPRRTYLERDVLVGIVPHVHPERHLLRRYRVAFRHYYSIFSWVLFCAGKKTKNKDKKGWMDGWSSKMRHRREIVSFFNRSINQRVFFCVCALCVCVLDFVDFWYGFYISRRRRAFHQKM